MPSEDQPDREEQGPAESDELYRLLAENSSDLVTLHDLAGRRVYASPAVERATGRLPDALLAGIHPEDQAASRQSWERILAGERTVSTIRHSHADGSWRRLETRGSLVQYRGTPHVLAVTRDVTERLQVEAERQAHLWHLESMERVNRIIQGASELEEMLSEVLDEVLAIFGCDRAWVGYPCDPSAELFHVPIERTRPEFPGAFAQGVALPLERDANLVGLMAALRATPEPLTFGSGGEHPLPTEVAERFAIQSMIATALYPRLYAMHAFGLHQCSSPRVWATREVRLFREIGRRLEDALSSVLTLRDLRASEARLALFRSLIERTRDAIEVIDPATGRILDVNERACLDHGYTRDEYLALHVADVDPVVSARPWEETRVELVRAGEQVFESQHRRKDGSVFPVEVNAAHIHLDRDYFLAVVRDISERKRVERAMVESHSLLNAVVEGTADTVFVKDLQGRYLLINSAGARFIGRTVAEVIGKHDRELFAPESAAAIVERDRQVLASGEAQTFEETTTAAGVTRSYVASRAVYRDSQGTVLGLIGISSEVTGLKHLEEQLRQSQKMEAVGALAGGIAHDFNNLLTVINGYTDMVRGRLSPNDPGREPLAEVLRAGERASTLTRQLLAFSRKQVLQPKVVDLEEMLRGSLKLLERLIREDVELVLETSPGLGWAKVDPAQCEQAIINLVVNARDAMPHGGRLVVATSNADLDAQYAERRAGVQPGPYVLVAVSDTGHGMDEETKRRIFEPFFTTKAVGEGTGLGLAIVYGFVKQSGGHVEVESAPGEGTTVRVFLPRVAEPGPLAGPPPDFAAAPRGTESVLLVEDEDTLRKLARNVLQASGYVVLEARDGEDALRVADRHHGPIHLLLSDLVMPRMGGRQVAERLLQVRPRLRVLFMSGYSEDHEAFGRGIPLLQKPFTPSGLSRKVREVLDLADPA